MKSLRTTLKKEYRYYLQQEERYSNLAGRCFLNGYISGKTVYGKKRKYLQFSLDHKLKSVYLSEAEADIIEGQLTRKKEAEDTLEQIRADLHILQDVLSSEDQRSCRNDVNTSSEPLFREPSMYHAVGISPDYHQLYFWETEAIDREKHIWMYYLLIRYKRKQYRIDYGCLNEDVRHYIPLLQSYAGWKVDDFLRTMEIEEEMHELTVRTHASE